MPFTETLQKQDILERLQTLKNELGNTRGIEWAQLQADDALLAALTIAGMSDIVQAYLNAAKRIGFCYLKKD